jgi:ribonuclease HI
MTQQIRIYTDGAMGREHCGAGVVVTDEASNILQIHSRTLPVMTSNEAEYAGLLLALEIARGLAAQRIEICMDSEVVVNQMTGRFAIRSRKLKPLHQKACELARAVRGVRYRYIPRDRNLLADAVASEAALGRRWTSA